MREEGVDDVVVEYSRVETNGLVKSTLRPEVPKGKDPTTFVRLFPCPLTCRQRVCLVSRYCFTIDWGMTLPTHCTLLSRREPKLKYICAQTSVTHQNPTSDRFL